VRPYLETAVIFVILTALAWCVLPALVRQGCKGSVVLRDKVVWRLLDPRAVRPRAEPPAAATGACVNTAIVSGGTAIVNAATGAVRGALSVVGLRDAAPAAAPSSEAADKTVLV
jgi:hypothetical protein